MSKMMRLDNYRYLHCMLHIQCLTYSLNLTQSLPDIKHNLSLVLCCLTQRQLERIYQQDMSRANKKRLQQVSRSQQHTQCTESLNCFLQTKLCQLGR